MLRRWVAACALAVAAVLSCALISAPPSSAGSEPLRLAAFQAAVSRAGDPYIYGDAGPYAFDCSGLVVWAYGQEGITLPRTTYEMLDAVSSGLLIPTSHPVKGDLAFYGSGHVEFFVRGGHTFGAHQSGQPVGWIAYGGGWVPTMFFRVRGAG